MDMPVASIEGVDTQPVEVAYELIGEGRPWALTPGGRFSMDYPGVRQLAEAIADDGNSVLIWDRPNTGASGVCFAGDSESAMQADALAGLITHLGLGRTIIAGGSGGSRVSLLTATRHPDLTAGLATWWISGGTYGLMSLGVYYCGPSFEAAWHGGMEAVAALPEWQEPLRRNPKNRDLLLAQDRQTFLDTMERWMLVYCPCGHELVPGVPDRAAQALDVPALVFRSGASDLHHTRATSEALASLLPHSALVEPPWPDTEWNDRHLVATDGLFVRWPLLAPQLLQWAADIQR
jgi:pimeloyl-ACP methyl ester carboxylesterase